MPGTVQIAVETKPISSTLPCSFHFALGPPSTGQRPGLLAWPGLQLRRIDLHFPNLVDWGVMLCVLRVCPSFVFFSRSNAFTLAAAFIFPSFAFSARARAFASCCAAFVTSSFSFWTMRFSSWFSSCMSAWVVSVGWHSLLCKASSSFLVSILLKVVEAHVSGSRASRVSSS